MVKDSAEYKGIKIISENRKARFNYFIEETFEAGLVLTGGEIKSIRQGHVLIAESYVRPKSGELFVFQMAIEQYSFNTAKEYDAQRPKKLLLSKREISRLIGSIERKGLTIVPTKIYLKNGFAKLEIALAKGKAAPDKRETVKKREGEREARRAIKGAR
jgi:SsrA-binding protein